jgi:hypothetical protein
MAKLVILQYSFLFDPSETWGKMSEFDSSFSQFLAEHDMEAEIVTPIGVVSSKILFIHKKEKQIAPPPQPEKTTMVKGLNALRDKKTYT